MAEQIVRHEEIIRGTNLHPSKTNIGDFREILKDNDSEINKVAIKVDTHSDLIKSFDKKINRDIMVTIENIQKQIMQYTNIANSINDKFKTTNERVTSLSKQFNDYLDNYGLNKFKSNSNEICEGNLSSNLNTNQFVTTQGLQDFKSNVYKQIMKM